ncbi:YihY/virulence factor BrkB family protein [Tabrizicola aquatica]|uniref:YihY/virulence factor BrkB family protein n=1 Tax=Tabrizicola aquatica TaxID=909926 RepID=UPI000CD1A7A3|nr:YihY/virulence factor BrkB family protein [Tabrizicola aquatica]
MIRLSDLGGFLRALRDEVQRDRVLAVAAGVTFYALLAVVPAITALISIFGLILAPEEVPGLMAPLAGLMPEEARVLVTGQAERIAAKADDTLSLTALVALAVALWSANGGTKALIEALGIAYDVREMRGFVRLTLVAVGFTLGGFALVVLIGAAVAALPFLVDQLGPGAEALVLILRWPVILAVMIVVLAVVYCWGPNRPDAEWRWITPGAVIASVGLVAISGGMGWYVANFGSYDETYGSLAAVVVLMLWVWLSTVMVLLGAEINAELDRRTAARR